MRLLAICTGSEADTFFLSSLTLIPASSETRSRRRAYLERGQLRLLGQEGLLLFRRVGVVAVLVQPVPEDLHRLLRQIPPPLPLPVAPATG